MELFVIVAKMTQPFTNVNTLKLTGCREYTTCVKKLSEAFCGSRGRCMVMSFEPAWVGSRVYVHQHALLAGLILFSNCRARLACAPLLRPVLLLSFTFWDIQKRLRLFPTSQGVAALIIVVDKIFCTICERGMSDRS